METLFIEGPVGPLEACMHRVEGSHRWAVVCHPHPQFGGTMSNKVVTTLAKAYELSGINVVRFNFRGIGQSAGEYDNARGETQDCLAVMHWVMNQQSPEHIFVAGFSFGSYVAAQAAHDWDEQGHQTPEHLLLIAPSVANFPYDQAEPMVCPTTVVIGNADEIVPVDGVLDWAGQLYPPVDLIEMEEAGHFFHGRLLELRAKVMDSIAAVL